MSFIGHAEVAGELDFVKKNVSRIEVNFKVSNCTVHMMQYILGDILDLSYPRLLGTTLS